MAAQGSQSIQILLSAEAEADKIVQKARDYRVQKLKDAKVEASKEIEALKQAKLLEFQQHEQQFAGHLEELMKTEEVATRKKIEETRTTFASNRAAVLQKVLDAVVDVQPKMHTNFRLGEEGQK